MVVSIQQVSACLVYARTCSLLRHDKGAIVFGHIHEDAAVTSGVMVRSPSGDHQMSMDIDGQRKGWTQFIGPGNFTIKHGF